MDIIKPNIDATYNKVEPVYGKVYHSEEMDRVAIVGKVVNNEGGKLDSSYVVTCLDIGTTVLLYSLEAVSNYLTKHKYKPQDNAVMYLDRRDKK